ncbi:hypothetical protein ACJMK2_034233 [Sinanodonta woodiana]|uniref:Uncharacterized protein n=1 Tax=Sinanodonta woodiana TaxID=1069815 RepID=A0ABD3WQX2_SINWO
MGSGISQNQRNKFQPSQSFSSRNRGNTATQHGHVTDALPMDHSHGMQAMSNSSPEGTAPSSGPMPRMTWKEFESVAYCMNHEKRGMAIIINNKTFQPHLKLEVRSGTDADSMALLSTFQALGFDVKPYDNKTVQEMITILSDASNDSDYHRKSDCFICAILTHGDEQDVLYGTDGKVGFEKILSFFKGKNCPGLVGKPKLFFIQACRGNNTDKGVALDVVDARVDAPRQISIQKIPIEADILRAHSSVPGFAAWRHEKNGSWFIQALTEMLTKNWMTMDLLTILTCVNQKVAHQMTETEEKQVPMFTSTLTKVVFFTPKES